ncbi:hypothetical protein JL721_9418 [Aureococcus anophagefferens]|nr:hypothetical protein JL721_9418 [Aureococcus anophagefferens]
MYAAHQWGDRAWEKAPSPGAWQPATLPLAPPDPYAWWGPPVPVDQRWGAWGAVDRALEGYLAPPAQEMANPVAAYGNPPPASPRASGSAVVAASAMVAPVATLSDTVRRMEERTALAQERDAARLRVAELERAQ